MNILYNLLSYLRDLKARYFPVIKANRGVIEILLICIALVFLVNFGVSKVKDIFGVKDKQQQTAIELANTKNALDRAMEAAESSKKAVKELKEINDEQKAVIKDWREESDKIKKQRDSIAAELKRKEKEAAVAGKYKEDGYYYYLPKEEYDSLSLSNINRVIDITKKGTK